MKIKTTEALFSHLEMMQFVFESKEQMHKPENLLLMGKCLDACSIIALSSNTYYRARRIYGDSEGIIFCNGVPQNGFASKNSGVAPVKNCEFGRANDKYEQVLYVAEDEETTIQEVQTPIGGYASVATCRFVGSPKVFDFSPYTEEQLQVYVKDSNLPDASDGISQIWMYMEMQRILTLPEYSEDNYIVSRELIKIMKEKYPDVSGIMYASHYTGKKNVSIWDNNKFVTFSDGEVFQR